MILGFLPKNDRARKVFQFNPYADGTLGLLGLSVDHDLVRWLRVLLGLPLSFATLHGHKILIQTGRVGRFRMNMSHWTSRLRQLCHSRFACSSTEMSGKRCRFNGSTQHHLVG